MFIEGIVVIINTSVHERQLRSARYGPTSLVYLYGVIAVPTQLLQRRKKALLKVTSGRRRPAPTCWM
jgi:hypothetical protein